MAESTNTLQTLRRAICKELGMPFFKKYGTQLTVDASSTTTKPIDSDLTQADDYWTGDFFYRISSQESRQITDFAATSNTLTLEYALSTISASDAYEIHSIWNAYDIHAAINRAIEQAAKSFPATVTDENLVLEEDKLAYTISGLTSKPWRVRRVWIERVSNTMRGLADSSTNTTLVDASLAGNLGDVNTSWKISIYAGTGTGQLRSVSSANNSTGEVTITSAWTTNPDTTSKYALWNPTEQIFDWFQVVNARFDAKEYPDTLYLYNRLPSLDGMRIRLEYLYTPQALSSESDTTTVNTEFIIAKTCSILHGQMVGDSRYNRELHYGEHVRYKELADELLKRYRIDIPDETLWTEHVSWTEDNLNPLNWRGDEY